MKRRAYLAQFAGLLCGTAFAGPALSADLYRPPAPAPAAVAVPAYLDEWSGVYVGLEGGFGWGRQKFESASITGFGSSIGDVARSGGTTLFPAFNGPNGARSIGQSGALFGGFAGVQKQWANWVLGFETDVDVSWIRGSSASSGVQNGVRVSSLQFGSPAVPAAGTGPAEVPESAAQATGSQATAAQATPGAAASRASSSTSAAAAATGGTAPASFRARWPSVTVSTTVSGFALASGRGAAGAAGGGAAGAGTGAAGAGTAAAGAAGTGAAATQGASNAAAAAAAAASAAAGTRPAAGAAGSGAAASGGTAPAAVPTITVSTTIRGLAAAGTGAATGTGNAATTASATSTAAGGGGSGRTASGGASSGGASSGGTAPASAVSWAGAPQAPVLQQLTALTNVSRTVSVDSRIDELGSLRGKFGFTPAPQWLIYATGGLAFAHVTNNVIATESFAADLGSGTRNFSRSLSTSGGATLFGWALGAGVDWKWTDTNWIVGVEYLHYDFPAHTLALGDSGGGSTNLVNSRQSVDAVKGRISYLFPIH